MDRRKFLQTSAALLSASALKTQAATDKSGPHFAPNAKKIIYLFMTGGPSQLETFDYKPQMKKMFDKDLPTEIRMGQRITNMNVGQSRFPIAASVYDFKRHGQSGAWVSELLP